MAPRPADHPIRPLGPTRLRLHCDPDLLLDRQRLHGSQDAVFVGGINANDHGLYLRVTAWDHSTTLLRHPGDIFIRLAAAGPPRYVPCGKTIILRVRPGTTLRLYLQPEENFPLIRSIPRDGMIITLCLLPWMLLAPPTASSVPTATTIRRNDCGLYPPK